MIFEKLINLYVLVRSLAFTPHSLNYYSVLITDFKDESSSTIISEILMGLWCVGQNDEHILNNDSFNWILEEERRPFQWLCFSQKTQSGTFDNLSIPDTENNISSPECITMSSWSKQIIFSDTFIAAIWLTGRESKDYLMRFRCSSTSTWLNHIFHS